MNIEELISNASVISNKLRDIQVNHYNERKAKKGNFNFFSAIVSGKNDKQHIEKYHSNVIGYFLDRNASHDFGALFLKQFLKILGDKEAKDLPGEQELEKLTLERERRIDAGRFIDISLELGKRRIIFIENKIYSGEQTDQMKDYFSFAKGYTNCLGIYLTLDGGKPSSIDPKDCDDKLVCMSYTDIAAWLQSCCDDEEVKEHPHVLSALNQYITIIKNLLKAMKEDKMAIMKYLLGNAGKKETVEIVKNFRVFQDSIMELIIEVRNKFRKDLIKNLDERIADKPNYPKYDIHQGDFVWNSDIEDSYGLGFQIKDKEDKYFDYDGGGFRGTGNGIFINKDINAHFEDGIDQANGKLLECYNDDEKWNAIINYAADKIIEEIEGQVLPKYQLITY